MLLETPLVIGRDRQGKPFALRDACPHRGMPLSCGRFDGQNLECSYHGWKFDAHTGQCQLIPSLTADQRLESGPHLRRQLSPAKSTTDYIWVFIPEPASAGRRIHARRRSRRCPRREFRNFQRKVQTRLSDRRPAMQRGSRHHRPDGSGARAVRPPGLVVAQPPQHSRKAEKFRADSQRLPHERAHSQLKQRALQAVAPLRRRRFHHHDH